MFRLVTFFLHVKSSLLILVSGYSESLANLFQNAFYFIITYPWPLPLPPPTPPSFKQVSLLW